MGWGFGHPGQRARDVARVLQHSCAVLGQWDQYAASVNPPDFGFSAGGHSETGDVMLDILVPDTISSPSTTYKFPVR
jgi:hypothetical protein